MTTDPFTTADDQWDESPHHLADHCEHAGVGKACRRCRRKFDAAAQWARAHLAAQEPTDAEVEAAARAMRIETLGDTVRPGAAARWWDNGDVSPDEADKLRRLARAALSAARAARRDEEAR